MSQSKGFDGSAWKSGTRRQGGDPRSGAEAVPVAGRARVSTTGRGVGPGPLRGSAMHDRLPTERHAGRGNSAREWGAVRVLMVRSLVLQPHNEEIAGVGVEHLVAQSVIATSQSCWRASKKGTLPGDEAE